MLTTSHQALAKAEATYAPATGCVAVDTVRGPGTAQPPTLYISPDKIELSMHVLGVGRWGKVVQGTYDGAQASCVSLTARQWP